MNVFTPQRLVLVLLMCASQYSGMASCIYSQALSAEELEVGNLLTWSTVEEEENQNFVVQKSEDGVNFFTEGIVRGSGSSDSEKRYRYLDLSVGNKRTYYRLVDVDAKGMFSISGTIVVDRVGDNNMLITAIDTRPESLSVKFQSATEGEVQFSLLDKEYHVWDMGFIEVIEGQNAINLNIENLPDGDYRIALERGEEKDVVYFNRAIQAATEEFVPVASKKE